MKLYKNIDDGGNTHLIKHIKSLQPDEQRKALARELIRNKSIHNAVVTECLKDNDPFLRSATIEALFEIKEIKVIKVIHGALNDKNWNVRNTAVEILGTLKSRSSIPFLHRVLRDNNEIVRINALEALGLIKSKPSIPIITKLLRDKNKLVRAYAALSLGEIGSKNAVPALFARLDSEKSHSVKLRIYSSLYKLGENKYYDEILNMIDASNYKDRCAAVNILTDISDSQNKSNIKKLLRERLTKENTRAVKSTITDALARIRAMRAR